MAYYLLSFLKLKSIGEFLQKGVLKVLDSHRMGLNEELFGSGALLNATLVKIG